MLDEFSFGMLSLQQSNHGKVEREKMSIYVFVSYEPDGSPSMSTKDRKVQLKVSSTGCIAYWMIGDLQLSA